MSPEQQLTDLAYLNEVKRKMRDFYKEDYIDELTYKHDLDEIEKLLTHKADMNELKRLGEWTEQFRYIFDKLPNLHLFFRQGVEFLDAERRADRQRADIGKYMEAVREKARPLSLEFDLTGPIPSSRSIEVRPARHHRKLRGGESLIFRLRSPVPGYISIFNFGTSGDTLLIYPNYWEPRGKIEARAFLDIPGNADYECGRIKESPYGIEVMRAFVMPVPVSSYIPVEIPHESFCRWTGWQAKEIVRTLGGALEGLDEGSWAMGEMSFEVVPN